MGRRRTGRWAKSSKPRFVTSRVLKENEQKICRSIEIFFRETAESEEIYVFRHARALEVDFWVTWGGGELALSRLWLLQ